MSATNSNNYYNYYNNDITNTMSNIIITTNEEKKQSRIPKTLSIIHNYIDYDSSSIIEEYLIKDVDEMFTVGECGIWELLDYDVDCVYGACVGGHTDIVKIFTYTSLNRKISWGCALRCACEGGNIDIINFIISENKKINWNSGLRGACRGGNMDIVELIITKSENKELNWSNYCLSDACRGGNIDIVKLLIEKSGDAWLSWNAGLMHACKYGHTHIINLMIEKGATYCCYCNKRADDHLR